MRTRTLLLFAFLLLIAGGTYLYYVKIIKPTGQLHDVYAIVDHLDSTNQLQNGDIIFQTSLSPQSQAIQLATHSPYSHCGIINWEAGDCSVWEAHNGVEATDISQWIARGKGHHFVIKRLKRRPTGDEYVQTLGRMDTAFYQYLHKPYDIYFGWGDDKLYCSELVWKIYKQALGIEVGQLQKLGDFDLSNPVVKSKMKQRYGNKLPLNETVISPAAIFNSDLLETVVQM